MSETISVGPCQRCHQRKHLTHHGTVCLDCAVAARLLDALTEITEVEPVPTGPHLTVVEWSDALNRAQDLARRALDDWEYLSSARSGSDSAGQEPE